MILIRVSLIALAALLVPPTVIAAEGPTWVTALQLRVHPGMEGRYEQLVRRVIDAHDKLESDVYWNASTSQYGPNGLYIFARAHTSMETLQAEQRDYVTEAFGERAAREWAAGIAETVADATTGMWVERPDLSVMAPEDSPPPANLGIFRVVVKPYRNADYEAYLMKSAEATRAVEPTAYYVTYAPQFGADNTYVFVAPLPAFGNLGPPPKTTPQQILEHFGDSEGAKLLQARDELVAAQELLLANVRPDLSRVPAASMAEAVE